MNKTLNEAYYILKNKGYIYKGRTITRRTVRTMVSNEMFETLHKCPCGHYLVEESELEALIETSIGDENV